MTARKTKDVTLQRRVHDIIGTINSMETVPQLESLVLSLDKLVWAASPELCEECGNRTDNETGECATCDSAVGDINA